MRKGTAACLVLLAEKLLEVRGDLVCTANLLDCDLLYYRPTVRCLSPPRALSCQACQTSQGHSASLVAKWGGALGAASNGGQV